METANCLTHPSMLSVSMKNITFLLCNFENNLFMRLVNTFGPIVLQKHLTILVMNLPPKHLLEDIGRGNANQINISLFQLFPKFLLYFQSKLILIKNIFRNKCA